MNVDYDGNNVINGILFQLFVSIISYLAMLISSFINEDVKNDMKNINWNPFNDNAEAAANSKFVSFYKGVPIFRINADLSMSFGAVFLCRKPVSKKWTMTELLKHEYGHTIQQLFLGPVQYLIKIGIPSDRFNDENNPWEIIADKFGKVTRVSGNEYKTGDVVLGWIYFIGMFLVFYD